MHLRFIDSKTAFQFGGLGKAAFVPLDPPIPVKWTLETRGQRITFVGEGHVTLYGTAEHAELWVAGEGQITEAAGEPVLEWKDDGP